VAKRSKSCDIVTSSPLFTVERPPVANLAGEQVPPMSMFLSNFLTCLKALKCQHPTVLRNMTLKRVNIARYGRGTDSIYKMTVGIPVEAVNL